MFRLQWLHILFNVAPSRMDRRRLVGRNKRPVRLVLETLEERVTPAQTAGSYSDLVSAVAADTAANTNYVIDITNSFTFAAGGAVSISKLGAGSTLTIQGQPGTNFTLTGNGSNLFDVAPRQNVTLNNLTLTGGSGVSLGGAIIDEDGGGNVTLSGMTITSNAATGFPARGGGVYVAGGALPTSLLIQNSTIANNVAQGLDGSSGEPNGANAEGGGVYVSGLAFVQITNSTLSNNRALGGTGFNATIPESNGGTGGLAAGGGLFTSGTGWDLTLTGDTFSGNAAFGAIGGRGAAGLNAVGANSPGGNGGDGGDGGDAHGGGLFTSGDGSLAILNDLTAPLTGPSVFINNSAIAPFGAAGGAGGKSTGSAKNSIGGAGNNGANAFGGGVYLSNTGTSTIANATFYGNSATAHDGGAGGAAGTGGTGGAGAKGGTGTGGTALGGGLFVNRGTFTMLNSTVAKNTGTPGPAQEAFGGGGVWQSHATSALYENNTITQNSVTGGSGGGMSIDFSTPSLFNNLIQGNTLVGFGEDDLDSGGGFGPAPNSTNNFVSASFTSIGLNPATNIEGKATAQLGSVIGLSGGAIYYPLLAGSLSIGAGTPNVLNSIATAEGTTPATDEVGDLRTSNGTVSIGAVQPLPPGAPLSTTIAPGNASVNFYGTNVSPALQIAVGVNSAAVGNVSVSLLANNTSTPLGTAPVGANGLATVSVPAGTLPASLQAGSYQLIETYSCNASFSPSNGLGLLTITTASTQVVAGSASINLGSSSPFSVAVGVNSPAGTVNSGSVSISLVSGTATTPLGAASVTNGIATISVPANTLPTNLQSGSYQLTETYSDGASGPFAGSSALGTLTVSSTPTPSTSVTPGNAVIGPNGGKTNIVVLVNSSAGTVNEGTVTIRLANGGTSSLIGSAPVMGGYAHVPVSIPSNLSAGSYQLIETYSDSTGHFNGSSALGTLTVNPVPPPSPLPPPSSLSPQEAAVQVAIDAAALVLQDQPLALIELEALSYLFLRVTVPGTIPDLLAAIQSLYPDTGGMGLAAFYSGLLVANNLEQNPS
jgi:hypothetical protein